jgi:hypothetical protein
VTRVTADSSTSQPRPAAHHRGQDHTVPEAITKSTLKRYRHSHAVNDFIEFPDGGHSLTIDHGWRDVAQACLDWLYKNSTPKAGASPSLVSGRSCAWGG